MISYTIAVKVGRSKRAVNNYFKLEENYGKNNTENISKALSSRDERQFCRLASTGKYSTNGSYLEDRIKCLSRTISIVIRRS